MAVWRQGNHGNYMTDGVIHVNIVSVNLKQIIANL